MLTHDGRLTILTGRVNRTLPRISLGLVVNRLSGKLMLHQLLIWVILRRKRRLCRNALDFED